jgi:hypothetical protein
MTNLTQPTEATVIGQFAATVRQVAEERRISPDLIQNVLQTAIQRRALDASTDCDTVLRFCALAFRTMEVR